MNEENKKKWLDVFSQYEQKTDPTLYSLHAVIQHWLETEKLIESDAKEEVKKNKPTWTPENEDEHSQYLSEQDQARLLHDQILIPMHRYSCMVMLYSTVERELRRVVESLEKVSGKQILTLNDFSGSPQEKVKKLVEVFFGLKLSDCGQFESLCDLQKIRDCIIHCLGDVGLSRDKKFLMELGKKIPGYWAHPGNEMTIDSECIRHFIVEVWSFFIWLFHKFNWKIASYYSDENFKKWMQAGI